MIVEGIIAPQKIQEMRLEICKKCEFFASNKFCKKCGCHMPTKVKLLFVGCPEKKWKIENLNNKT